MGIRRLVVRHGEELRQHRRLKQYTSFGTGSILLVGFLIVAAYESFVPHQSDSVQAILVRPDLFDSGHRRLSNTSCSTDEGDDGGAYPADPIISMSGTPPKYANAPAAEKLGIIVHIILVGYMLLGLNTVCDIYFCGALDVMVDTWQVKPDVAGATFMAAGGSAPELFTSLIGAVITENDVGFGTIVGSAVFNVLAVIGACGMSAKDPIKLTWWPLFRDCSFYICGLTLLACCAYGKTLTDACTGKRIGGGSISLIEAIVLFGAYLLYCTLMFFNEKLEAKVQGIVDRIHPKKAGDIESGPIKVAPMPEALADGSEAKPFKDDQAGAPDLRVVAASVEPNPGPPEHHIGRDQPEAESQPEGDEKATAKVLGVPTLNVPDGKTGSPAGSPRRGSKGSNQGKDGALAGKSASSLADKQKHHHIEKHIRVVHHKAHLKPEQVASMRRSLSSIDKDPNRLSPRDPDGARRPSKDGGSRTPSKQSAEGDPRGSSKDQVSDVPLGEGCAKEEVQAADQQAAEPQDKAAEPGEGEEGGDAEGGSEASDDDVAALMEVPESINEKILWVLSLPIYAALYYCIPRPTTKMFMGTFVVALIFIAGFSFVLVYCVELFGKAILGGGNNVTVVMSFTILAAGTSIPDLVSSMAVARAGEGDMAVSSSIGSNIFDILVGLPIPWIIKIACVERSTEYVVAIKSPYIALYVLLLLFMVFMVIISIHVLGWKLNQTLGYCMAGLYVVFLAVVLPVELIDAGPYL
jgi:K+-dependent Na+/Ca+ exchanger-like protein